MASSLPADLGAALFTRWFDRTDLRRGVNRQDDVVEDGADDECLDRIRNICAGFPGADEGLLQDRPLFRVGRRRFAIFNGVSSPPRPRWARAGRSLHFLSDPSERDALVQDQRFGPSPHHGDRGWFALSLLDSVSVDWTEIEELLHAAYIQVRGRHT